MGGSKCISFNNNLIAKAKMNCLISSIFSSLDVDLSAVRSAKIRTITTRTVTGAVDSNAWVRKKIGSCKLHSQPASDIVAALHNIKPDVGQEKDNKERRIIYGIVDVFEICYTIV